MDRYPDVWINIDSWTGANGLTCWSETVYPVLWVSVNLFHQPPWCLLTRPIYKVRWQQGSRLCVDLPSLLPLLGTRVLWVKAMLSSRQSTPFSKELMSYLEAGEYIGHFASWKEQQFVLLGIETYFRNELIFSCPKRSTSTKQKTILIAIYVPYKSLQTKELVYMEGHNRMELHSGYTNIITSSNNPKASGLTKW